jgi:hypothetical protein
MSPIQLVLGKGWIPWPARLRFFVVTHRRAIPIIGALIVFGTFLIKDTAHEYYRNVSGNLATAQSILAIRTDTTISKATLEEVSRKTEVLVTLMTDIGSHKSVPDPETLEPPNYDIWELIGLRPLEDVRDNAIMAALEAVCRDLPKGDENCKKLPDMKKELELAMKAGSEEFMFRKNDYPYGREAEEEQLQKDLRELSELRGKNAAPFSERLSALSEKITARIEEVRADAERIDRWLGNLSIVLYSLGWGLGFFSTLYGDGSSVSGE